MEPPRIGETIDLGDVLYKATRMKVEGSRFGKTIIADYHMLRIDTGECHRFKYVDGVMFPYGLCPDCPPVLTIWERITDYFDRLFRGTT